MHGDDSSTTTPAPTWPTPVGAVEILPFDAQHTMYEVWRNARLDGLGGSDLAAVVLPDWSWESQLGLWLTKTGRRPPIADNYRMERGRRLEAAAAQWFADETGLGLRRTGTWAVDGQRWARCNPDRFTSDGGGLEIKTTGEDWGDLWRHGPALHAVVQALWCMAVTGLDTWYIAALMDDAFRWWRIDRGGVLGHPFWRTIDPQARTCVAIQWIVEVGAWWWNRHVVQGIRPVVDASEATTTAIKEAVPAKLDESVVFPGLMELRNERKRLKAEAAATKKELDLVENQIKAGLISAETGIDAGQAVMAWSWVMAANPYRQLKDKVKKR